MGARRRPPHHRPLPFFVRSVLSGPDGAVEWWGDPLTDVQAGARLKGEEHVVVRGPSRATTGMRPCGWWIRSSAGTRRISPIKGRCPLPHFHPQGRFPGRPRVF